MSELNQGWGFPDNSRRAHYFLEGQSISLCGRWVWFGERFDDKHDHHLNCAACKKKRAALREGVMP